MSQAGENSPLSGASFAQISLLTLLRVAVGWHLAYEGVVKLLDPHWTAAGYLEASQGFAAGLFRRLAADPQLLWAVDLLNMWGLTLLGLALVVGCFTRLTAILAAAMLMLYYVAQPPLFAPVAGPAEGSYLLVNKTLIETFALLVIAAMPPRATGLDGLWSLLVERRRQRAVLPSDAGVVAPAETPQPPALSRRRMLASLTGLPVVGGFAWAVLAKRGYQSHEQDQLLTRLDAVASPSIKVVSFETLDQLKKTVPTAPLGDVELSRVILGGNLMNGFAHARDLIYVSRLIRAYHTDEKIFQTFRLAEACGINAIITNPILAPVINEYWDRGYGQIRFIAQCKGQKREDFLENIQYALDHGACAAYVQGACGDAFVRQGHFDWLAEGLEKFRAAGIPAGLGGHYIETIRGCVDAGLEPDFWMKTLHHHRYWSADTDNQHDNIWCEKPEETIQFMAELPQPWIAFKVLAAGAIPPKDAFRYAFENGADFICAGMYDFQVVENANIVTSVLEADLKRSRDWCA